MNILWESNAPWVGTGYGVQTRLILRELLAQGHKPTCFAFYGLNGGSVMYDGYPCIPGSNYDEWGNDCIGIHTRRTQADVVVTLIDLFVLSMEIWNELDIPWIAWVPIDSATVGEHTLERLRIVDFPVAMSQFGANEMRKMDIEPAAMIYHAVDTDVYKPGDKAESREMLGLPEDAIIVGMVMANKGNRKQFPKQLLAVKQWADKNPDLDIRVYLHTEPTSLMGGYDIRSLVKKIGLEGRAYSTNQYDTSVMPMSPEAMAKIYNSFDVLMNCSMGEGFGVPIIEAQACGVPVIATNATAMPELVVNGYLAEVETDELALHMGWQFVPSVEDMVYRLECAHRMLGQTEAAQGRAFVENMFHPMVIGDQWFKLLLDIEEDIRERRSSKREVIA